MLVEKFANKHEKTLIKKVFEALDTDADGQLTPYNLSKGFEKTIGNKSKAEILQIFKTIDFDDN